MSDQPWSQQGNDGEGRGATGRGSVERLELSRRAQTVARRAAEAKATIPHLYLTRTVEPDSPAVEARVGPLLVAVARSLSEHRGLNAGYRDGGIERYSRVNLGFTVETPEGAQVPTVFDADQLTKEEIATRVGRLSAAACDGSLTAPEVSGSTFSVTLIEAGADAVLPIVSPGHSGHVALGRPRSGVVPDGDSSRKAVISDLTLACDQRAVRPSEAAAFLGRAAALLEESGAAGG